MKRYAMLLPVCIAAAVFVTVAAYGQRRPAVGRSTPEKVEALERQVAAFQTELTRKLASVREEITAVTTKVSETAEKMDRQIRQLMVYQQDAAKHKVRFEIKASPLSDEVRNCYHIEQGQGVRLTKTSPELEKAGLKKGCALVALNGTPVKHDAKNQISPSPASLKMLPGDVVTFTIVDAKGKRDVEVILQCAVCKDISKCPMLVSGGRVEKKTPGILTKAQIDACKSNLATIFRACITYSMDPENKIFPFAEEESEAYEHLQLLVDTGVVDDPKIFICPGSKETPAEKNKRGNLMLSPDTCSFAYTNRPRSSSSRGIRLLAATKRIIEGPDGRGIVIVRINGGVEWVPARGKSWEELTQGLLTR